jgi:hypothetical protein
VITELKQQQVTFQLFVAYPYDHSQQEDDMEVKINKFLSGKHGDSTRYGFFSFKPESNLELAAPAPSPSTNPK